MNSTTAPTTNTSGVRTADRFSLARTLHLARWNAVLLGRNRLALVYGTVLPLTALATLFAGDRGEETLGAYSIGGVLLLAALFPVYYNILSQFVSRRDELVLKRMRTGEVRDAELLVGIALPGVVLAVAVCAAAVPIAAALGQPLPVNAVLYAVGTVLAVAMFAAFAYWTAAWTRSAEAAQLTSMPVIILAAIGPMGGLLAGTSDTLRELISWTPGAAMTELVRVGWFGFDGGDATTSTLTIGQTWELAAQPTAVLVAWTALAIHLAARSMRWEPRS